VNNLPNVAKGKANNSINDLMVTPTTDVENTSAALTIEFVSRAPHTQVAVLSGHLSPSAKLLPKAQQRSQVTLYPFSPNANTNRLRTGYA
jgi:hypothetical protein